ncbi:MAG: shikimate dehydrogenase [Oleiphilus sp.]|nr:MAG: shikimate dehydrogenase [Oleiphilus sp.]
MSACYAVVGNPVSHSKSPQIHALFASQTGQDLTYSAIELALDGFAAGIKDFFNQADNKGLNVTVPFKEQAFALCDVATERAQRAGAVNTLWQESGRLFGDTTDGVGLVNDLGSNHGVALKNKKILVVGAGGAVRGVLQPILEEKPLSLTLCNRTASKLAPIMAAFSDYSALHQRDFASLEKHYDVIINGTSASLHGGVPDLPDHVVGPETVSYDMMYGKETTSFNAWAMARGASKALDGLGMLVEQAAQAFFIWRGVAPETRTVLEILRS